MTSDRLATGIVAFIGLGSNLDNPIEQIRNARMACRDISGASELAFSSLYSSPPMGPQNQPDYVNAVMSISTTLTAMTLLKALQHIEHRQGRVRTGERWTARTLDLDLLVYGSERILEADLIVPHPGLAERAFVIYPLFEIAPNLLVPGLGALSELIVHCPQHGLKKIDP